jgi:hypothetical protein
VDRTDSINDVNSSHARSGDSIYDSIEPINSARIKRHGEAALTTTESQTLTSNANNVLVRINDKSCNEAHNVASDTKMKNNIKETNESFTNQLLQLAEPMQHTPSTGDEQNPAEKEEDCQKQQIKTNHNVTSYRRVNLNTTETHSNDRLIRVTARKPAKPHPLYKAHFNDMTKPCWIPVTAIPP